MAKRLLEIFERKASSVLFVGLLLPCFLRCWPLRKEIGGRERKEKKVKTKQKKKKGEKKKVKRKKKKKKNKTKKKNGYCNYQKV